MADEDNSDFSDEDDITPPVVNNVIVLSAKTKVKPKTPTKGPVVKSKPNSASPKQINPPEPAETAKENGVIKPPPPPEKVKVIVRCRPISAKEIQQGHVPVVKVDPVKHEIEVHRPNPSSTNLANAKRNKIFTFDNVYDERASQTDLYEEVFRSLVESVLDGFNGTIFAYGQTGTGKTHTMEGIRDNPDQQGVIPHAFKHVFDRISASSPAQTYLVRASYLEIYQEEIRDLLFRDKIKTCELKESNGQVYVKDLSTNICRNFQEINELMSKGNKNRSVGATNMNEHSSRSHAIFLITIEMSETWADNTTHIKVGKLNLVDLAGSERQGKTGSEGDRLKEAVKINLSLSALGHVIGALAEGNHSHIPYRDSKLTRLLQDSLGGNSRTIMVATIGPASFNYDETMVTLRYASRAKRIKNKPKVNEDPKDAMLKMYQDEIAKLKALLDAKLKVGGPGDSDLEIGSPNMDQLLESISDRPKSRRNIIVAERVPSDEGNQFDKKLMKELEPFLIGFGLENMSDPKQILRMLEEKRKALLQDNETVKAKKDELVTKLESAQERVRAAEDECGKLHTRIEWLESKVINGGKSLLDHTNEQQKQIELHRKELEDEKQVEDDMKKKIAEHDMSVGELRDMVAKLEAEFAHKTRKLAKIKKKVLQQRQDRDDRAAEFVKQMAQYKAHLLRMQNEVKSSTVVMDNFVPPKFKVILESLVRYNKADDSFSTLPITSVSFPRPAVDRMIVLPLYNKCRSGKVYPSWNLYYTDENILQLHFDGPRASTLLYTRPDTDAFISSMLQRALADAEAEVTVDCTRFSSKRRRKATAKVRLGEILTVKGDLTVRPVLSSRHRSKEIPYKDYVVVTRVKPRPKTGGLPSQRSSQSQQRPTSASLPSQPDPQGYGDIQYCSAPEEYLRVPYSPRYRELLGDCCTESLNAAEVQKQLYLETRSPTPIRVISPRDLEKVLTTRRQIMVESGQPVPDRDLEVKAQGRLSQLLASCDQCELELVVPEQIPRPSTAVTSSGSQTYRVDHPKTVNPHVPCTMSSLRSSLLDADKNKAICVSAISPRGDEPLIPTLDPVKSRTNHYPGTKPVRGAGFRYANLNPLSRQPAPSLDHSNLLGQKKYADHGIRVVPKTPSLAPFKFSPTYDVEYKRHSLPPAEPS